MGSRGYTSFRGRMSKEEQVIAAARKREAAETAVLERQTERDDLSLRFMAIAESLRKDVHLDARRVHRVDLEFPDNGDIVVQVHSRVFPAFTHVVPASFVDYVVSMPDEDEEEEEDGEELDG